jgi:hypothetical protein
MSPTSSLRWLALASVLAFAAAALAQSAEQPAPAPSGESRPEPVPSTAPAVPAARPTADAAEPRAKWTRQIFSWASVGTTFAYGQTYGSANAGVGYLMKYGIAPNVELGYAFGNSPTLWSVRPGVTWFMPVAPVRPYVGTYYTHWFVGSGLPDQDGIGGRAGLSVGRVVSLGVAYDHVFGCSVNCDSWTPQISAGLSL